MNKRFLNFIMLLLLSSSISFAQKNETIDWSSELKLEWEDFKGNLDPNVFAYAKTSYKIEVIPEDVLVNENDEMVNYKELNVIARFYKKHSWTVSNNLDLLEHERLHFDIAELFARKIRRKFSDLKNNGENRFTVYYSEYKSLWQMCRLYQKNYDQETNHGANLKKNKEWILNVKKEINELRDFTK